MRIDPTVYDGRPADETGRLPREIACYDLLDRLQLPYRRVDHEAADTIDACQQIDRLLGAEICKNLFLCNRQQTDFYLLLLPGGKVFRTRQLSAQLGCSRLSFADAGHMRQYLGLTPGSVSVLGLMNDREQRVRLLIDRELLGREAFGCHPCINTSSLLLRTRDVIETLLPALGHGYTLVDLPPEESC